MSFKTLPMPLAEVVPPGRTAAPPGERCRLRDVRVQLRQALTGSGSV